MATERCPKCGSEMVQGTRWVRDEKWGKGHEKIVPGAWVCPDPKNCRIIELQRESATFKATAQGLLDFQKQDRERIAELERQLEEAQTYKDRLRGECVGALTDAGACMLADTDPCAPGEVPRAIREILRASEARERELQGKLDEAKAEPLFSQRLVPKLIAERNAALDQVVELKEALEDLNGWITNWSPHRFEEELEYDDTKLRVTKALSNTSTTAQQRIEAIRREAVEAALAKLTKDDFRIQQWTSLMGNGWVSLTAETALAAILGEREADHAD